MATLRLLPRMSSALSNATRTTSWSRGAAARSFATAGMMLVVPLYLTESE